MGRPGVESEGDESEQGAGERGEARHGDVSRLVSPAPAEAVRPGAVPKETGTRHAAGVMAMNRALFYRVPRGTARPCRRVDQTALLHGMGNPCRGARAMRAAWRFQGSGMPEGAGVLFPAVQGVVWC